MEFNTRFDAKAIENEVRGHLEGIDLKALLENELAGRPLVGYIEGPPTMNGEPHAGHLRGRVIKDLWYRFNTLRKNKVIFRAGWDTQGLPVELAAEKELGLTGSKAENISKVGIEKIVETCKRLIHLYNEKWLAMDRLLGMSFNYDKAYWTYRDDYIEREWQILKKAWERNVLTEWYRVVAYCPSCQTSLSNAEVNQGYETVEDPSFYYKVKMTAGDEDAYLIVWTTMPFTIVTDEMVGVNPGASYSYVWVTKENMAGGERWVVGSDRLAELMKELRVDDYKVEKEVKGSELDGRRYVHPLLHLIPGLSELAATGSVHFVVAEDFVDTATGSGLVHLSPANGEEDFEIAHRRNVPIFVPIDDRVVFTEKAGAFKGLFVRDADMKVFEAMKEAGASVKMGRIKHQYPTCWRSHHKVVWLARREYFYLIDRLGDGPVDAAQKVDYFFEQPKNRFIEIIKEQHPWCISRERVWGTPLPIWSCGKCGHKEPLFSRAEIVKRAVELPDGPDFELHRPWIDRIKIKCEKCGAEAHRESFVLDTWHNSGAAPYASLTDQEYSDLIPASLLTEGIDQTRGWAYTLLMEGVIMSGQAPFRSFLFQGHVLDEKGNKMSKSIGNVIDARKLLSDNPVDLVRLYFMWKSSPIEALNFSPDEMRTRTYQVLSTLHNLHVYFRQNSEFDKFDADKHTLQWVLENNLQSPTEVWLLSKLQGLVTEVTGAFERCRYHEGAKAIDSFIINHLSQTYVPLTRNVIWDDSAENLDRRLAIYAVLGHALEKIDIMLHPLSPFITEYLYTTCFSGSGRKKSVLLEKWPERDEKLVNAKVEGAFDMIKEVVSLANAARNLASLKRRWPVDEAIICGTHTELKPLEVEGVADSLKGQLNAEQYRTVQISAGTQLEKASSLLAARMPIAVSASLVRKAVAPRVKADINAVLQAFESVDRLALLSSLRSESKYTLAYGGENKSVDITPSDVEIAYRAADGYSMAERGNLVVFVSTRRDKHLMAKGLLRDLARNLQQLRKERQYNPTDILSAAYVAGLDDDETSSLSAMKDEMAYLVRVKAVVLSKEPLPNVNYKKVEIDGREFSISVE
jgi:isoleucyl-tRNA synthetase